MWLELLEYALTPCPRSAQQMGYLSEVVNLRSRYKRCWQHWENHVQKTHQIIQQGIARCSQHRKVVILGGGLLHDVPLKELSQAFQQVLLVDLVHPLPSRWQARRYRNVQRVTADVTNTIDAIYRYATRPDQPLPSSEPDLFLNDTEVDLTVSLNLLSQLPCMPMTFLSRRRNYPEPLLEDLARQLIQAHMNYLDRLPGKVTLITDIERLQLDKRNQIVERRDLLFGLKLPKPGEEWQWHLAPIPEVSRKYHYFRRVVGIADWK